MPKVSDQPIGIKPFVFLGIELTVKGEQAQGECPFCGKPKLYVNCADSRWKCHPCEASGNATSFIRKLWEWSNKTSDRDYLLLAKDRGLLSIETLKQWGVRKSFLTKEWLVPGFGKDGRVKQLYRYVTDRTSGKKLLLTTPGLGDRPGTTKHYLHGLNLYTEAKKKLYVCEGPWDGMALWEVLKHTRCVKNEDGEDRYTITSNESASMLADADVVAMPGAGTFSEGWGHLCIDKEVIFLLDNDHPRGKTEGNEGTSAGLEGTKRAARILVGNSHPVEDVSYLCWGKDGYDPDLPSGTDVRDILNEGKNLRERVRRLPSIFSRIQPIPDEWVEGYAGDCLACNNWNDLVKVWKKAMKWVEGLDRALAVMLASVASTKTRGDQLWVKIIAPASSGKSVLCEAVSMAKDYVLAKSTIRGFHSGFNTGDGRDVSLIAKLLDKTLVTKDADTLLQSPNLGQILSEARDIYDRVSRTHYRTGKGKDYEGVSMTWILCGTNALRSLDSSELGERFLDCVIIDEIDEDLEDEIGMRVAYRAARECAFESNGKAESRDSPEMLKAKRMTGGYINYLRNPNNTSKLLEAVKESDDALRVCQRLGKFVAYMRARPSIRQQEKAERELSYRLVSQMVRLAKCLAVVLNKKELDKEVLRRVRCVALDTARGKTLEIAKWLYSYSEEGLDTSSLAVLMMDKESEIIKHLLFLQKIKVLDRRKPTDEEGNPKGNKKHWYLTDRMYELYERVVNA